MRLLSFLFVMTTLTLRAQFPYTLDESIPVQDLQGNPMRMPWAGGLNAAQFNTMDLDGDGTDDLVLYDRTANKVITFLANNNQYVPAPEYEAFFPADIYNWLLLRDYNCDGKKDIFTGDVLGIKVFLQTTDGEGPFAWKRYLFDNGFGGRSDVLMTKNPLTGNKVNLQLQFDDLPSVEDMDGDGDLDIINIQYSGHTIEFHQNLTQEQYQSCDSLEFIRVTRSWGSFRECDCGVFAFNNAPCPPSSGGRVKHAGGKSLLALDLNGDSQQDILFSEAECTQLFALPNKGTAAAPVVEEFSGFPQPNPANFVLFPTPFYEDVDFDGIKDLIASPGIFAKEFLNTDLSNSTWRYRNTGSNTNPAFSFVERNFLQGEMIDVGDNAVPAIVDYNGDGLLDLIVSSHSSDKYTSRLYLFENTGSSTKPTFKLIANDFLGFTTSRYYNVKVQFADMDNNQTLDLVFTSTSFDNGITRLYYMTNQSQSTLSFAGGTLHVMDFDMTSAENVHVVDISGDGLPDLLVGRSEGNLEYWKNTGTVGAPAFSLEDQAYLQYISSPLRQSPAVAVADLDSDGKRDLILGDQSGKLQIISDFQNVTNGEEAAHVDIVFNPLLQSHTPGNLGGRIWPVVGNLFTSGKPAIVVGNVLGGVHVLRHDQDSSLSEVPRIDLYPNPVARDGSVLKVKVDRHGTFQIISSVGQQLSVPVVLRANEVYRYQISGLAAGLYLFKFTSDRKSFVRRFVVR